MQAVPLYKKVRGISERDPNRLLVRYGEKALFANQLTKRMNQVANGLLGLGLASQTRIAFLSKNTTSFYEVLLGAASVDMTMVPVNYRLTANEVCHILDDAQAHVLFVASEYASLIDKIKMSLPQLAHIYLLDDSDTGEGDYEWWLKNQAASTPDIEVPLENTCMQMYTSGTTGRPKGALITHKNLVAAIESGATTWGPWKDHDVILVCMPQYHIGASIWGLTALWLGVPSILTREFLPPESLCVIERHHVTKVQLAAAMMRMLLDDPACSATDHSSLELIIYGASTCPLELVRKASSVFACGIAQGYGLTEAVGSITYLTPLDHQQEIGQRLDSAGKPMEGVQVQVLDENGSVLPNGQVGEICCKGDQVAVGYWNLPDATQKSVQDGWLRTGDAGYFDQDGYLYVCDRVKDMIVLGGENIYPAEIESVLYEHPAISDVAVIGVPDSKWGEVPKAISVLRRGKTLTSDDVVKFLETRLAKFKIPRVTEIVEALPRNASGKVLKHELRRLYT